MQLHNPWWLIGIPVLCAAVYYARKSTVRSAIIFSSERLMKGVPLSRKARLSRMVIWLRLAALIFLIMALSRPRSPLSNARVETEGVDIVLAIDTSTSMLAEDYKIANSRASRIQIVKQTVRDFIKQRQNDRIAIVAFSARAYTVCPLTVDYPWLLNNLERIHAGMIEDGTAIGSGIVASLHRLENSKARSKVIILLTDGRNNTGEVTPLVAAEAAQALKVKIYTIGAGSSGAVPYPVTDFFGNKTYQYVEADLDEETLRKIADTTHAKYFRAADTESLKKVYQEIDALEKTPIQERGYERFDELFYIFLIPAIVILILEAIVSRTYLRRIP